VLTLWERGVWDDQDERIVMSRILQKFPQAQLDASAAAVEAESVDCLVNVPENIAGNGKVVAAGLNGGLVALVQLGVGKNEVIDVLRHHDSEGAEHIGFDVYGRVITGGGPCIKVWRETKSVEGEGEEEDEENVVDEEEVEEDEESEEEESSSESEEERPRKRKKGRHGNRMGSFKGLD
jgi:WD repeat-containing protein 55